MNKIYKVIWSKVRQCYVVVCEYAKGHTKGCSTARLFANRRLGKMVLPVAVVGMLNAGAGVALAASVDAGNTVNDNGHTVNTGIAIYNQNSKYEVKDNVVNVNADNPGGSVNITDYGYADTTGNTVNLDGTGNTMAVKVQGGSDNTISIGGGNSNSAIVYLASGNSVTIGDNNTAMFYMQNNTDSSFVFGDGNSGSFNTREGGKIDVNIGNSNTLNSVVVRTDNNEGNAVNMGDNAKLSGNFRLSEGSSVTVADGGDLSMTGLDTVDKGLIGSSLSVGSGSRVNAYIGKVVNSSISVGADSLTQKDGRSLNLGKSSNLVDAKIEIGDNNICKSSDTDLFGTGTEFKMGSGNSFGAQVGGLKADIGNDNSFFVGTVSSEGLTRDTELVMGDRNTIEALQFSGGNKGLVSIGNDNTFARSLYQYGNGKAVIGDNNKFGGSGSDRYSVRSGADLTIGDNNTIDTFNVSSKAVIGSGVNINTLTVSGGELTVGDNVSSVSGATGTVRSAGGKTYIGKDNKVAVVSNDSSGSEIRINDGTASGLSVQMKDTVGDGVLLDVKGTDTSGSVIFENGSNSTYNINGDGNYVSGTFRGVGTTMNIGSDNNLKSVTETAGDEITVGDRNSGSVLNFYGNAVMGNDNTFSSLSLYSGSEIGDRNTLSSASFKNFTVGNDNNLKGSFIYAAGSMGDGNSVKSNSLYTSGSTEGNSMVIGDRAVKDISFSTANEGFVRSSIEMHGTDGLEGSTGQIQMVGNDNHLIVTGGGNTFTSLSIGVYNNIGDGKRKIGNTVTVGKNNVISTTNMNYASVTDIGDGNKIYYLNQDGGNLTVGDNNIIGTSGTSSWLYDYNTVTIGNDNKIRRIDITSANSEVTVGDGSAADISNIKMTSAAGNNKVKLIGTGATGSLSFTGKKNTLTDSGSGNKFNPTVSGSGMTIGIEGDNNTLNGTYSASNGGVSVGGSGNTLSGTFGGTENTVDVGGDNNKLMAEFAGSNASVDVKGSGSTLTVNIAADTDNVTMSYGSANTMTVNATAVTDTDIKVGDSNNLGMQLNMIKDSHIELGNSVATDNVSITGADNDTFKFGNNFDSDTVSFSGLNNSNVKFGNDNRVRGLVLTNSDRLDIDTGIDTDINMLKIASSDGAFVRGTAGTGGADISNITIENSADSGVIVSGSSRAAVSNVTISGSDKSSVIADGKEVKNAYILGSSDSAVAGSYASVIASDKSIASGEGSSVSASLGGVASGKNSSVVASDPVNASGEMSFIAGSQGSADEIRDADGVLVGYENFTTEASGKNSVILASTDSKAKGKNSIVLAGKDSVATNDYDVAIGYKAVTGDVHNGGSASDITINDETYDFAGVGKTGIGTVSFGSAGNEKQLQNIAAGDVTASSTDAVNGSQLYAVVQAVEALDNSNAVQYDGDYKDVVTLAGADGTVIKNVKAGELSASSTDAVNGSQLYAVNENVKTNTDDITMLKGRFNSDGDALSAVKAEQDAEGNIITDTYATKSSVTALASTISALTGTTGNIVQYDDIESSKITLTGTDGTVIGNLKAGELSATSTDAVNGAQLYAVDQKAEANKTAIGTTADGNYVSAGASVGENLGSLDTQVKANTDNITANAGNISTLQGYFDGSKAKEAVKAAQDADGNVIGTTYATKSELGAVADGVAANSADITLLSGAVGTKVDGNYITGANSVADDLSALDAQVKINADGIASGSDKIAAFELLFDSDGKALASVSADSAVKATQDADGNVISETYATKGELTTATGNIAQNASDIADITDKLGSIADGNYVASTDTYSEAVGKLDTQVKVNADAISGNAGKIGTIEGYFTDGKANSALAADTAVKATQDAGGNVIADTYATKTALGTVESSVADNASAISGLADKIGSVSGGNYVSDAVSVGENMISLDTQLKSVTDAVSGLNGSAVKYDDSDKAKITLEGSEGTVISNLTGGTLSATSTEAVNGAQLFATNEKVAANETAIGVNAGNIADNLAKINDISDKLGTMADGSYVSGSATVAGNLASLDGQVKANADDIVSLKTQSGTVADGSYADASKSIAENIGILDTQVKANADSIAANASDISGISDIIGVKVSGNYIAAGNTIAQDLTALDNQIKVNADAITQETSDRTDAVNAVNTRIGTVTGANYVDDSNSIGVNITALDTQAKANADAIQALEKQNGIFVTGNYIAVSKTTAENLERLDKALYGVSKNIGVYNDSVDKNYIDKTNTVIQNLEGLDAQLKTVSDKTTAISYVPETSETVGDGDDAVTTVTPAVTNIASDVHLDNKKLDGLSNRNFYIANIEDYKNSGTAATEGQLYDIATKGIKFNTDANSYVVPLTGEIMIAGDMKNISTDVDTSGKLTVSMTDTPNFRSVTSVAKDDGGNTVSTTTINGMGVYITPASGDQISLTKDGLNNGGLQLKGIAAGTDDADAVTLKQLKDNRISFEEGNANTHLKIDEDWDGDGTHYILSVDDKDTKYKADGLTIVKDDDENNMFSVKYDENVFMTGSNGLTLRKDNIVLGKTELTIDSDNGEIRNLTNQEWKPLEVDSSRAATEGQLADIAQKGWTIKGNTNSATVSLGSALTIKGDDISGDGWSGNIHTLVDPDKGTLDISLSNTPHVSRLYASGYVETPVVQGLTVKDFGNLTSYDNVDKRESHLASIEKYAGKDNAVSEGQLYNAVSGLIGSDRYIKEGYMDGTDLILKQWNAENVSVSLESLIQYASGTITLANPKIHKDVDNDGNKNNWTITEYEEDGKTVKQKFDNTTLATTTSDREMEVEENGKTVTKQIKSGKADISGTAVRRDRDLDPTSRKYGQSFTVMDTSGNAVTISDIASAEVLQAMDGNIIDHERRMEKVENGFVLKAGTEVNQEGRVRPGDTFEITANEKDKLVNENLSVSYTIKNDGALDKLDISIKDNPVFTTITAGNDTNKVVLDSTGVKVGSNYYITSNGLNAQNKTIAGVKVENISGDSHEALDVATFYPIYNAMHRGFTLTTDDGSIGMNLLGDTKPNIGVLGDGKNVSTSMNTDGNIEVAMSNNPLFGTIRVGTSTTDAILINNNNDKVIDNLSNRTWNVDNPDIVSGRAATEDELQQLAAGLSSRGMKFKGDTSETVTAVLGDTMNIYGGITSGFTEANNIGVEKTSNGLQIRLAERLNLGSGGQVAMGDTTINDSGLMVSADISDASAGKTVIGSSGLKVVHGTGSVKNDIEISADKASFGNERITNVASGLSGIAYTSASDNNAATVGDVRLMTSAVAIDGTNLTKTESVDANGRTTYTLGLSDNIVLGDTADSSKSININGTSGMMELGDKVSIFGYLGNANFNGIHVNGETTSKTITGLTNTEWSQTGIYNEGRAATEEQVQKAFDTVNTSLEGKTFGVTTSSGSVSKSLNGTITLQGADSNISTKVVGEAVEIELNNHVRFGTETAKQVEIDGTSAAVTVGSGATQIAANGTSGTLGVGSQSTIYSTGKAVFGSININNESVATVTGLGNRVWDQTAVYNAGRAATEEQLHSAIDTVNSTLKSVSDNYVKEVVKEGNNTVLIKQNDDGTTTEISFSNTDSHVKSGSYTASGGSVTMDIVNVDGVISATDKVTISGIVTSDQLDAKELSYKANDGTAKTVTLGKGLNFKDGTNTSVAIGDDGVVQVNVTADAINKAVTINGDGNIITSQNATTGTYDLSLDKTLNIGTGDYSISIDGAKAQATIGSTDSKVFIDGSKAKIEAGKLTVNGADGEIRGLTNKTYDIAGNTYTTGMAATEDQLHAIVGKAEGGWGLSADTGSVKADIGSTLAISGGSNITTKVVGDAVEVALDNVVNLGSDKIILDGTKAEAVVGGIRFNKDADKGSVAQHTNTVTGLSNTDWSASGVYTAGRAATEEQLSKAVKSVTDVIGTMSDGNYISSGGTIASNLSALDSQLKADTDAIASTDAKAETNKSDISALTTTVGGIDTKVTANTGDITALKGYFNADGKAKNALAADTAVKAEKDADGNVIASTYATKTELGTVSGKVADNASAIAGLVSDLADLDDIAVKYNDSTKKGIELQGAGGTLITNVKAGELSSTSTDAVNGSQLFAVKEKADANEAGIAANSSSISSLTSSLAEANVKIAENLGKIEVNSTKIGTLEGYFTDGKAKEALVAAESVKAEKDANGDVIADTYLKKTELDAVNAGISSNTSAIGGLAADITTVKTDVAGIHTDITSLDSKLGDLAIDVAGNVYEIGVVKDSLQALDDIAVKYDGSDKTVVTLQGVGGTKLTNVKAGEVTATSTDAVNGSQLYATELNVTKNAGDIVTNSAGITANAAGIAANKGDIATLNSYFSGGKAINALNADQAEKATKDADGNIIANTYATKIELGVVDTKADGNTARITAVEVDVAGMKSGISTNTGDITVLKSGLSALEDVAVRYDNTDKSKVTLQGIGGTVISNVKAGEVSATSTEAINGSQLYGVDQKADANASAIAAVKGSVTTLQGYFASDGKANEAVKAEKDGNGDVIADTYATKTELKTVSDTVDGVKTDVDGLKSDVTVLGASVTDMGTKVDGMVSDVAANKTDISTLKTSVADLDANAVRYTATDKSEAMFQGVGGTVIKNVKAGELSATSTDAVNGSQLHSTNANVTANTSAITANKTDIDTLKGYFYDGKAVKSLEADTAVKALQDGNGDVIATTYAKQTELNSVKTVVEGHTDSISAINNRFDGDGKALAAVSSVKDGNGNVITETYATKTDIAGFSSSISANAGDITVLKGVVGTMHDGNYIAGTKDVADNLSSLDTQVKLNADGIASNKTAITANADDIFDLKTALGNTSDGNYIAAADSVAENLASLDAQVKWNKDAVDAVDAKADTNAAGISANKGDITVLKGYFNTDGKALGAVTADSAVKASQDSDGNVITTTYAKKSDIASIISDTEANTTNIAKLGLTVGTMKDGNYISATDTVGGNLSSLDTQVKTNADKIADNASGIVSNKTDITNLTNKVGAVADGNYVSSTETVGKNINNLDSKVKANADAISSNTDKITANTTDIATMKGYFDGNGNANSALKAEKDGNGNVIVDTYATKTELSAVSSGVTVNANGIAELKQQVGEVHDGNYISADKSVGNNLTALDSRLKENSDSVDTVKSYFDADGKALKSQEADKAAKDGDGNVIVDTYATKGELNIVAGSVESVANDVKNLTETGIRYDDASKNKVTLEGAGGTVLGNVKAGELSASSMDAVNGSQLYALAQKITDNVGITYDDEHENSVTFNAGTKLGNVAGINAGASTVSGENAVVIAGNGNSAEGRDAAVIASTGSKALGNNSVVLAGRDAVATNDYDVAIGYKAVTGEAHTDDTSKKAKLDGTDYSYAGQAKTGIGTVSFGSAGNEKQLQNIAAGSISATSTDAVNGSQLYATNQAVNSLGNRVGRINDGYFVDSKKSIGENVNNLDRAVAENRQAIGDIAEGINSSMQYMSREINKSGANAAALAALRPGDIDSDTKLSIGAGIGMYHGQKATALGLFYRPNERIMFNMGGSMTDVKDTMMNLGVSFVLDRNVGQPLPSKKVMANEIMQLKAQNTELAGEVAELKALVTQLLAQNKAK